MGPGLVVLFLLITSSILPEYSHSEVIVHDVVALKGEEAMLKVETRGMIFRRGGQTVYLYMDGRYTGKTLSGGDGLAFLSFIPKRTGIIRVKATSGKEEGIGLVLSVKRGTGIVFIDVREGLSENQFLMRPRRGVQEAVKYINRRSPVVFLQTQGSDITVIKEWLRAHGFIDGPVIPWEGGEVFRRINERGLKIKAVIGGSEVIESASEYRPRAFSFEDIEGSEKVKDWEEIKRKLG